MKYKVIIVEDDPMVSSINEQYILKNDKFKILDSFTNGKDALNYCKNNDVDLAIVDYYMPIMNGYEFVKACFENNIKTDIIMISAANKKDEIERVLKYGVIDYLVKPFTYDRFVISLNRYIERKNVLNSKQLSQNEIDNLLALNIENQNGEHLYLEKGLQKETLKKIMDVLDSNSKDLTSEDIANIVGLSRITVRRYMNYLVENEMISSSIDYSTGGRPSIRYRKH